MANPSVIIHGPQGTGKTLYAREFMRHYGLDRLLDDADMMERPDPTRWPATGALILLTEDPGRLPAPLRAVPIGQALQAIGKGA